MNNVMNPTALLAANGMSVAERSKEALVMVVMGMVMVSLVLAVIMLVLMIMERIFAGKKAEPSIKKEEPATKKAEAAPIVTVTEDNGAVIAAISAAISVMLAEENGGVYRGGFRVVSFKRSHRGTPWNSLK